MSDYKPEYDRGFVRRSNLFLLREDESDDEYEYKNGVYSRKGLQLYAPSAARRVSASVEELSERDAEELLTSNEARNGQVREVVDSDITEIAGVTLEIGKRIAARQTARIVSPVRGGLKPGLQLSNILPQFENRTDFIPFSAGSQGVFDDVAIPILRTTIKDAEVGGVSKLAVVDTAVSGHSAAALGRLISSAAESVSAPRVEAAFYLIHERSRFPDRARELNSLTNTRTQLSFEPFPVKSLVVEDWEAALGLAHKFDGLKHAIEPVSQEGKLVLRQPGCLLLVQSSQLAFWFDQRMGIRIAQHIRTDPRATQLPDGAGMFSTADDEH